MRADAFARELDAAINFTLDAHARLPKTRRNAVRFADMVTPYAIHPIWCAMTLLTETRLPLALRRTGALALLWHDVLEDTHAPLPGDAPDEVKALVREMTFTSFTQEARLVWDRSDTAKLLKLYDKTSNLLDATWMRRESWNRYVEHTHKLTAFVAAKYGELNIVRIARSVAIPRDARAPEGASG